MNGASLLVLATMLTPGLAFILAAGQATVPVRPAKPLFQNGERPLRPADITFDPATRAVAVTLSVHDSRGYFVPNLHPENFAVYEDGVRQSNVTVDVEHAHVTLAVLFERGGRYQQLNTLLNNEIPYTAHALFDALQQDDTIGAFSYADTVQTLAGLGPPSRDALDPLFRQAGTAGFAEVNLFDAIGDVLERMRPVASPKAMLVISTVEHSIVSTASPLAKIAWSRARQRLQALSKASGGRTYHREVELDVPAIFDDVMEHLRVRYVVRYISPNPSSRGSARTVRIALVNSRTGAPLKIAGTSGKTVVANLSLQATYTP